MKMLQGHSMQSEFSSLSKQGGLLFSFLSVVFVTVQLYRVCLFLSVVLYSQCSSWSTVDNA